MQHPARREGLPSAHWVPLFFYVAFNVACFLAGRNSCMLFGPSTFWSSARQQASDEAALLARYRREVKVLRSELSMVREDLQAGMLQQLERRHDSSEQSHKSEERPRAVLAISIQVADEQLQHLEELLQALMHPKIAVMVHLDAKAPAHAHSSMWKLIMRMRRQEGTFASLQILTPSESISYRGISMLDVTLRVIQSMVASVEGWRFFINLSAQDYPLCRASELVALTQDIPADANFIDVNFITHSSILFHRVTHVVLDEALYRTAPSNTPNFRTSYTSQLRRQFPIKFIPYHGEAWNMLSAPFARYVATSTDGLPRRMFAFYANAPSSPEGFFQSLICASRFADTLVNDDLRFVDWSNPTLQHPPPISQRHLTKLKSVGALFARKFRNSTVTALVREQVLRLKPPGEYSSSVTLDAIRTRIQSSMTTNRTCAAGVRKTKDTQRFMLASRWWKPAGT